MKPYIKQYHEQKNGAQKRGIDWQFTYDEWINWWGDDINKRGRYKGQLVMARYGDTGPYHPNNVRKATKEENSIEAHLGKPRPDMIGNNFATVLKGRKMTDEQKVNYFGPKSVEHAEHIKQAVKITWSNEEYKKQRIETTRQKTISKYKNMSDEEFETWKKRFDGKSGCALSNLKKAQRIREQ